MRCRPIVYALLALFVMTPSSLAAIPQGITFQGQLTDQAGQPTSGDVTVIIRLYDALTGGTKLWEETQTVAVSQGLFSTWLGSATPLSLPFDQPYWVELQVGSETLTPRQPLSSSPYALRAKTVESLSASPTGNVGIGMINPTAKLAVSDVMQVRGAANPSYPTGGEGLELAYDADRTALEGSGEGQLCAFRRDPSTAWKSLGLYAKSIGFFYGTSDGGASAEAMRISSSGNVGIGTTSPTQRFEVDAGTSSSLAMFTGGNAPNADPMVRIRRTRSQTNSNHGTSLQFEDRNGTDIGGIRYYGRTGVQGSLDLEFYTKQGTIFSVRDMSTNFSPNGGAMEVYGKGNNTVYPSIFSVPNQIHSVGNNLIDRNTINVGVVTLDGSSPMTVPHASSIYIGGAPSPGRNMTITSAYALYSNSGDNYFGGNVGIGTASPSQKLEVNGAVRLAPSGAPSSPAAGTVYFDTTAKHFFGFDGTSWKQLDN